MSTDGSVGRIWSMRRPVVCRALGSLTEIGLVRAIGFTETILAELTHSHE